MKSIVRSDNVYNTIVIRLNSCYHTMFSFQSSVCSQLIAASNCYTLPHQTKFLRQRAIARRYWSCIGSGYLIPFLTTTLCFLYVSQHALRSVVACDWCARPRKPSPVLDNITSSSHPIPHYKPVFSVCFSMLSDR